MIEYEPRFVEEAVLLALRDHAEEGVFRAARDRPYEIPDAEARDAAFRRLHVAWFERLGLARPIQRALGEQPLIGGETRTCVVAYAASSRQEGAELFVRPPGDGGSEAERRAVVVRLTPHMLLTPTRLLELLRHELLHIADMLDPRFGYGPRLPAPEGGAGFGPLMKDRYRVLWDAYVDGRLARLGRARREVRADRLDEFRRAFPMLGERTEELFDRFFTVAPLRHAELVAFALEPGASRGGPRAGRCPLCGFPTHAFEPEPGRLPRAVREQIRSDFPEWDAAAGLCLQCADLYRSRSPSLA